MIRKKTVWALAAMACIALSACGGKAEVETEAEVQVEESTAAEIVVVSESTAAEKSTVEAESSTEEEESTVDTESSTAEPESTAEDLTDAEEEYEYPSEQPDPVVYESDMGYSMTYDPSVITLDDTGEADRFLYHTAESLAAPVYISVMLYDDMDAETLTEGLLLQSGIDGLKAESTYFGADSIETKCIYIEKDAEGATQIQIFYVIPSSKGTLLVETGGYMGVPASADTAISEMLGTFSLK